MESWREEFYGSDYGSQYLSHGRPKIAEGGARNGETNFPWRYKPIGHLPKYLKEKLNSSSTKTSIIASRPVSRERDVDPTITGTVGRRGEPLPLGTTAGEFTIGKDGLYESYAKDRPTTPPSGKTVEEPKPNGLTTEQAENLKKGSVYTSKDGRVIGKEWVEEHDKLAGGISNDHAWRENVARIDPVLANAAVRESMVDDLISKDGWFFRASETLGEDNAKSVLNKYLDEYVEYYKSIDKNKLYLKNDTSKNESKKPAPSPMKKANKEVLLDKIAKDSGSASINLGSSIESAKKTTAFSKGLDYVKKLFGQAKSAISDIINDVIKKR